MTAAAVVGGGVAMALRSARDVVGDVPDVPNTRHPLNPGATSPGDDGGGTSPGDDAPIAMPVRGTIDPPGIWNDYPVTGELRGDRLDATIDPQGFFNDIGAHGRVDGGGWDTTIDPPGWGGSVHVTGRHDAANGYVGTVDRPGLWNDVAHPIRETIRGAQVLREGRFDEPWTPSWSEASWTSRPNDSYGGSRTLEFDPPGWGNTTSVTLEGNVPAGVEATIAAHLYDVWKTEQERQADYPDTDPGGTSPGDDAPSGGTTSPGDDYPDV